MVTIDLIHEIFLMNLEICYPEMLVIIHLTITCLPNKKPWVRHIVLLFTI